jgi:hypothetical protein
MKSNVNFFVRAYWIKVSIAFLTCILFMSLPGCEEIKTPEELLIGTWFMESKHVIRHVNGEKTADYTNNYNPYENTILLQKDGTGKEYWFEGSGYYFSEDPFFWRITDGDSESCECILIFYRNDEFGREMHFCCTVNENYLTLHFSYEYECPPAGDPGFPPWGPVICKGSGSYSSWYWCNHSEWLSLKRQ